MGEFKPCKAFLFKKKPTANKKAANLRKQGFRALVEPSRIKTQKRSPSLKWVVFKGQKRKK